MRTGQKSTRWRKCLLASWTCASEHATLECRLRSRLQARGYAWRDLTSLARRLLPFSSLLSGWQRARRQKSRSSASEVRRQWNSFLARNRCPFDRYWMRWGRASAFCYLCHLPFPWSMGHEEMCAPSLVRFVGQHHSPVPLWAETCTSASCFDIRVWSQCLWTHRCSLSFCTTWKLWCSTEVVRHL